METGPSEHTPENLISFPPDLLWGPVGGVPRTEVIGMVLPRVRPYEQPPPAYSAGAAAAPRLLSPLLGFRELHCGFLGAIRISLVSLGAPL